jgi:hypothetical protein
MNQKCIDTPLLLHPVTVWVFQITFKGRHVLKAYTMSTLFRAYYQRSYTIDTPILLHPVAVRDFQVTFKRRDVLRTHHAHPLTGLLLAFVCHRRAANTTPSRCMGLLSNLQKSPSAPIQA